MSGEYLLRLHSVDVFVRDHGGDILVVYTDGITEACNDSGDQRAVKSNLLLVRSFTVAVPYSLYTGNGTARVSKRTSHQFTTELL